MKKSVHAHGCIARRSPAFTFAARNPGERMTVLIIAGSNEGVALAADGLQSFADGKPCIENGQKIWEGKTLHRESVLYGCYGVCAIERSICAFSFSDYSDYALSSMDLDNYEHSPDNFLADFACKVGNELQRFLVGYTDESSPIPLPSRIVEIVLGWYSGGNPFFGSVSFEHTRGIASWNREFVSQDVHGTVRMIGGSQTIYDRGNAPINTLQDAIAVVKKFAQDCVNNSLVIPDCSEFGGKVHVGALSESGFYWDVRP